MSRSHELYERAQKLTPGGVHSPVRNLKHVGAEPLFFASAKGAELFDVDGKRYIDFCLSFGPHILGHCPDAVVKVLQEQASKGLSFGACHPKEVDLVEKILRSYPFLEKVRLVNSGTEAVMTALRVARAYSGKTKILKFDGCYHGHLDALLAKAGSGVAHLSESSSAGVSQAQVADTVLAPLYDLGESLRILKAEKDSLAAIIVEPIPANHGLWVPPRDHLKALLEAARAQGTLVIFDEVISGFRYGLSGACGYYDLQPDIVTLGKIIGGGLPLAALAARSPILDVLAPLGPAYQAGTLSGNPMATAAGCAVLEQLQITPPYSGLEMRTKEFVDGLSDILKNFAPAQIVSLGSVFWVYFGREIPSFPAVLGLEQKENYTLFFQKALAEGIYLPPSPYEVGFLSTAHTDAVLDSALEKLRKCLR